MALAKTARTIIASASLAAAGTTRGTIDLETTYGGFLTMKITNGATGPTAACEGRVLVAHNATLPAAASAGSDWKTVYVFNGGTTNNGITEMPYVVDASVMNVEVEFTGNTGQAVTIEAFFSELSTV